MLHLKKIKTPTAIIILHLCTKNLNDMIYSYWDEHDRLKLVILGHFLPFYPSKNKKSKFWKNTKTSGDIILWHMCTINEDHMMYGPWDMECHRQNVLSFWTIFLTIHPPVTTQKIKILKKWKKAWRYFHFKHVHLMMIIRQTTPISSVIVFHFFLW